jgi:hypothetical protein
VANCLGRYELGRNIKLDSAGYNNINCQELFVTSDSLRCGDWINQSDTRLLRMGTDHGLRSSLSDSDSQYLFIDGRI